MLDKLKEIQRLELECGVYSVYDMDGKTTQEIFNQFFSKINNVIDATNASISLMEYLIDGGLKEETAKVFEQWIQDGTLKDILDNQVLDEINAKVNGAVETVQEQVERIEQIDFSLKEQFEFLKDTTSNNIKFYGAKGNGEVDDTDAFKKAVIGLEYMVNKTIFLPSGTYLLSESLELPEGTSFVGDSNTVIKLMQNNISIKVNSNVEIKNIVFEADKNIQFTDLISDETSIRNNISIINCKFNKIDGVGSLINIQNSSKILIKDCVFESTGLKMKCINIASGYNNSRILDNTFISTHDSIYVDNGNRVTDLVISNNTFLDSRSRCIYINAKNINILNNVFYKQFSTIPVYIQNTTNTKIKNNIYDVTDNMHYMSGVLYVQNATRLIVDTETLYIDSTHTGSEDKEMYSIVNAKDTIFNNLLISGRFSNNAFVNIKDSSVTFKNCTIELDAFRKVNTVFKIENSNLELLNNNINTRCDYLVKKEDETMSSYVTILNNNRNADVILNNVDKVTIENSRVDDVILTNTKTLILKNNTLNAVEVSSSNWDITSEDNIFASSSDVYKLLVTNAQECSLYSRNNYIKNANTLIRFHADKSVLDVNKMNIATINDTISNTALEKMNTPIVKTTNITSDIHKKCYVDTKHQLLGINYDGIASSTKLLNVKKPVGSVIKKQGNYYIVLNDTLEKLL